MGEGEAEAAERGEERSGEDRSMESMVGEAIVEGRRCAGRVEEAGGEETVEVRRVSRREVRRTSGG